MALDRRRTLGWLIGAALPFAGCGGGGSSSDSGEGTSGVSTGATTPATTVTANSDTTSGTTVASTPATTSVSACATIPEETAGPYPADGSNTANGTLANALALSGIVRSDIRSSIAGASAVADGVTLTVKLRLVDTNMNCADLAGFVVYLWHCDRLGRYSMYSSGVTAQNYLRGVQVANAQGEVSFTTIFPGCYDGRMPHIHFEVYRSLSTASTASFRLKTSQIALPPSVCQAVYATTGYAASVQNLARVSFATDNVFSDGTSLQLASVTGSVSDGYQATLTVGVAA
ncbi:intradiol ring-cleavage dioxygenase [Schlegelella sp. ID0723]|uniref:Intradiol ring-cleavage dioxygenase n=2 Tax=Piscinibacter koreensis TaxID=2742824 RepID=A0A7Y6NRA3_9BURK|nr:intradiol ring-cleavage dioxygenase [Schlegelella koreensis]